MSIPKILFRLLLIFLGLILFCFLLILINTPNIMNSYNSKLMCENTLKMIANAIKLYEAEWEGQWPPSLLELGPFYEGKYKPGPNSIPKCPGDRNEHETSDPSEYYYFPPNVEEVVPVCWDSKPHYTKVVLWPDSFMWNVLYSDGHVERLSKEELIKELVRLAETNPDILKILNSLNERK
jgi:hypothetical protein